MKSLSDLRGKKRNLEAEREELVRRWEELDREIIDTQAECVAIYNSDSPILSLPAEVTCLIFREAFSTLESSKENDIHPTELILSHVCRQWRSTALELSFLWSSFYYHGPSATPATLNRFEVYLNRSKSNRLELWLDLRETTPDQQLWAMLDQTIAVVSRWWVVSIFSNSTEIASRLKSKLKALYAPNLEHLTLHLHLKNPDTSMITSIEPQFITEGAPKLTSVWLDVSTSSFCLPPISILTTLRIEFQEMDNFSTFLFSSAALRFILTLPNLENLSVVEVESRDGPNGMGNATIVMNRLRHLRIKDSPAVFQLLPTIRAPILETLVLRDAWINFRPDSTTNIHVPNVYSFPSLASLSLNDVSCRPGHSMRYFTLMTSAVRQINVAHTTSYGTHGVLRYIVEQLSTEVIVWPHLENLICDLGRVDLDSANTLLKIVMQKSHTAGLTLRVSEFGMKAVKELILPDPNFAGVLTIEEVTKMELGNLGSWPPGGNGLLSKRIDLEADSFSTRRSTGFLYWS